MDLNFVGEITAEKSCLSLAAFLMSIDWGALCEAAQGRPLSEQLNDVNGWGGVLVRTLPLKAALKYCHNTNESFCISTSCPKNPHPFPIFPALSHEI